MRTGTLLWIAVLAACSAPQTSSRAPLVAPLDVAQVVVDDERNTPASADRSPPEPFRGAFPPELPPSADPSVSEPSGDEASPARPAPIYRSVVETVEVPVYAESPGRVERDVRTDPGVEGVDYYGYVDGYRDPAWRRYGRRRPTPFPVNTAIGAGIGAIVGHQRGRRGRGALVGAGVGLLFDLHRWVR